MSEDTKKIENTEHESKAELSQQELDKVDGGDCASPKLYATTSDLTSEIVVTKPI